MSKLKVVKIGNSLGRLLNALIVDQKFIFLYPGWRFVLWRT